jgi:Alpha/beta hydrolase domain
MIPTSRPRRRAVAVAVLALVLVLASSVNAVAGRSHHRSGRRQHSSRPAPSAAVPTVTGPIADPSQIILPLASYPLSSVGYHESEFLFSGTANAYTNTAPLGSDGDWSLAPASTAPYESRMVVVAPNNPARFSGTVIVEWLNVSASTDAAPDWEYAHDEMLRNGDVYVGISAQAVGINAIKAADPTRYGALNSPGDSYSYDIFSQGGMALRALAQQILPGLHPHHFIADGESQSASRMTTYVDGVAPLTHVYDAYLIHSRGAAGAAISQAPQPAIASPSVVETRTDQSAPVLTFETETDVVSKIFNYYPATQADSKTFRLWEVAGTTHLDSSLLTLSQTDDGSWAANQQEFAQMFSPPITETTAGTFTCTVPFNTGEEKYVMQTAVHDLTLWTQTGTPPRSMPRFNVNPGTTPSYVLDANGNVTGGLRTPAVDTPVATLSGLAPAGAPGFCILFGQTTPFTAQKLASLYPSHRDFARDWDRSVRRDLQAGYLLPRDAATLQDVVNPLG